MATMQIRARTAAELLALPTGRARHELVRGELHAMTPAGFEHGAVTALLGHLVGAHVIDNQLGQVLGAETGFLLATDPDTVRAPDFAFVRRDRVPAVLPRGYFRGPPDLAAEVVSPSDRYIAVEEKARSWLEHGCVLVWILNPVSRAVTALRSTAQMRVFGPDETLTAEDLLPGFARRVGDLFPG